MSENYDLSPAGADSPVTRLHGDTLEQRPERRQSRPVTRHGLRGGDPTTGAASEQTGVEPGVYRFVGWWVDPDTAETLADRLEMILNDPLVDRVELQAVDVDGNSVSSRYNGTYRLGGESRLTRLAPGKDVWRFDIRLTEAN